MSLIELFLFHSGHSSILFLEYGIPIWIMDIPVKILLQNQPKVLHWAKGSSMYNFSLNHVKRVNSAPMSPENYQLWKLIFLLKAQSSFHSVQGS